MSQKKIGTNPSLRIRPARGYRKFVRRQKQAMRHAPGAVK